MKNLDIENLKDTQLLNEFISAEFESKMTENNNNTTISDCDTDIIKGNIYIIKQDSHEYSTVINTEKFELCDFIRNNLDLLYKHFCNEVL